VTNRFLTVYGLLALSVCSIVLISISPASASEFPASGQFDQVTTITAPRMQLKFTQSISFKGPNIRVDKTDLAQLIPLTQIETPDTMYLFSSVAGTGEKSPITQKLPPLLERMDSDTKSKLKGASKIGTDSFEGYSCDIYKTSDANGEEQIEFWVSTDQKFPFTLKTVATDKLLGKVTTVDLENISLTANVADKLFLVPSSIKFAPPESQNQGKDTAPQAGTSAAPSTGTDTKP